MQCKYCQKALGFNHIEYKEFMAKTTAESGGVEYESKEVCTDSAVFCDRECLGKSFDD